MEMLIQKAIETPHMIGYYAFDWFISPPSIDRMVDRKRKK